MTIFMVGLFVCFTCGFLVLFSLRNHLLLTLISIEFLMIFIYFLMFFNFCFYHYEFYFLLIFLVLLVCEGSLGLSILVSLIRCHGNDLVNSLYLMLW